MSNVRQGTLKGLDQATIKKLREHNKSIIHQRMEDAEMLRQRLEQWKEEKKRKKMLEQKKVARFVTTVLKPVKSKLPVPSHLNPDSRKSVCRPQMPNSTKAVKVGQAVKPATKVTVVKGRSRPLPACSQRPVGKENQKCSRSAQSPSGKKETSRLKGITKSASNSSKMDPKQHTPLSRKTVFGKRHTIVHLTARMEEGQGASRPPSLAEELQDAARGKKSFAMPKPVDFQMQQMAEDNMWTDIDNRSETDAAEPPAKKPKHTHRDSLTAKFRKSKSCSDTKKKNPTQVGQSVPRAGPVKKGLTSTSDRMTRPRTSSNPPRSILKRKSCGSVLKSSAEGASPVLPAARPSHRRKTTSVMEVSVEKKAVPSTPGKNKEKTAEHAETAASAGHVTFAVETGKGDRQRFPRTPGRNKTHEYMKAKLDEWLAAKGRTPTKLRHSACFGFDGHCNRPQTPRSQVQASMSVRQLTKQEKIMAKEDALSKSAPSTPSLSRGTSKPLHYSQNMTLTRVADGSRDGRMLMSDGTDEDKAAVNSVPGALATEGDELYLNTNNVSELESDFRKCAAAIESGLLSPEAALEWLDLIGSACEKSCQEAGWYRCRVAAYKMSADKDAILAEFERAIINNAQPAEEMAQLLTSTMRELLSGQSHTTTTTTPTRTRRVLRARSASQASSPNRLRRSSHLNVQLSQLQRENVFKSTSIKYSVKEVTPFKKRRRATEGEERLVPVVTPVRRSARLTSTKATSPESEVKTAKETTQVAEYSALEEIPSEEKDQMLFQPNHALEPLLSDVSSSGAENSSLDMAE